MNIKNLKNTKNTSKRMFPPISNQLNTNNKISTKLPSLFYTNVQPPVSTSTNKKGILKTTSTRSKETLNPIQQFMLKRDIVNSINAKNKSILTYVIKQLIENNVDISHKSDSLYKLKGEYDTSYSTKNKRKIYDLISSILSTNIELIELELRKNSDKHLIIEEKQELTDNDFKVLEESKIKLTEEEKEKMSKEDKKALANKRDAEIMKLKNVKLTEDDITHLIDKYKKMKTIRKLKRLENKMEKYLTNILVIDPETFNRFNYNELLKNEELADEELSTEELKNNELRYNKLHYLFEEQSVKKFKNENLERKSAGETNSNQKQKGLLVKPLKQKLSFKIDSF